PNFSPIYAICDSEKVANSLTLNWGVRPFVVPFDHSNREKTISRTIELFIAQGILEKGNTTVVISSIEVDGQTVKAVQMREV
ncbi:MAG: pyruvate kinase alpha/beta domain-containing protein, partial [Limisphaerales bacterium]